MTTNINQFFYKGLFPYSAADLMALDNQVENGFVGNIPEYLIENGLAVYDDNKNELTIKGYFPIKFVKR